MTEASNPPTGGTDSGGQDVSALDKSARLFGMLERDDDEAPARDTPRPVEASDQDPSEVGPDDIEVDDDQPTETTAEAKPKPTVNDDVLVTLGDGSQVTLAELKAGHLRQADYTRKTQAVAEERRQAQEVAARSQQQAAELAQQLQFVQQIAAQYLPKPPDPAMVHTDIFEYTIQKEAYERKVSEFQQLAQLQQAAAQRSEMERQQRMKVEQQKFLERMPELKDPAKFNAFKESVFKVLPEYGFTPEDTAGWLDHRVFALVSDAVKYRNIVNGKRAAVEQAKQAQPVMKPGTRNVTPPTGAQAELQRAKEQFNKSRSVKDAGAVLARLLK